MDLLGTANDFVSPHAIGSETLELGNLASRVNDQATALDQFEHYVRGIVRDVPKVSSEVSLGCVRQALSPFYRWVTPPRWDMEVMTARNALVEFFGFPAPRWRCQRWRRVSTDGYRKPSSAGDCPPGNHLRGWEPRSWTDADTRRKQSEQLASPVPLQAQALHR